MSNPAEWHNCRVIFRKTSFIDFPGIISAVLFFPGCNLRCPWCHNRELVLGNYREEDTSSIEEAVVHIEKRQNVIRGVVLSGGEPTLFGDLGLLIKHIKTLGLKVKIDTNGLLPGVLKRLFDSQESCPDYIAMDLKTVPDRYTELLPGTATDGPKADTVQEVKNPGEALIQSVALIRASGVAHEFRSLELPPPPVRSGSGLIFPKPYLAENEKKILLELIGGSTWNINPFVPGNCVDPAWDSLFTGHESYNIGN